MRFKLIYPIKGNIHEAISIKEAVKLCYNDIPNKNEHHKISIINIDTSEIFTFKVTNHNKIESLNRIEKKIDKLIRLTQQKKLEEHIAKPSIL
jgi:hypothetical protein